MPKIPTAWSAKKAMDRQASVSTLIQHLVDAWNRADSSAFANLFTADGDYVTGAGIWLNGREAIADLLRTAKSPPQVLIEGDLSFREYGVVSSAIFHWVTDAGIEPRRRGVVTCLLVKCGDGWLIARLHNTDQA
jgi:ketosteroid isomerase-like protein